MDTSEPVNNLDSHVLHHQEEEEEEVQDKEEVVLLPTVLVMRIQIGCLPSKVLSASQPLQMTATLIKLWERKWKISNPVGIISHCYQIRILLQILNLL